MTELKINLSKQELNLLKACILIHIEFATSTKNDKSYELGKKLVALANTFNIQTGYEDFFKDEDILSEGDLSQLEEQKYHDY